MAVERTVQLGRELFSFHTRQHWINKARSWFATAHVPGSAIICLDAVGRICTRGEHFARAKDENAYPITAYAIELDKQLANRNRAGVRRGDGGERNWGVTL